LNAGNFERLPFWAASFLFISAHFYSLRKKLELDKMIQEMRQRRNFIAIDRAIANVCFRPVK